MKFSQLIEYNLRSIFFFFEKPYTKCGGEIIPESKLSISVDQYSKFSYVMSSLLAKLKTNKTD